MRPVVVRAAPARRSSQFRGGPDVDLPADLDDRRSTGRNGHAQVRGLRTVAGSLVCPEGGMRHGESLSGSAHRLSPCLNDEAAGTGKVLTGASPAYRAGAGEVTPSAVSKRICWSGRGRS